MKQMWVKLFQGIFIGVALVLPGMSGGTAILILGIYRPFLKDLSGLRLKKYLPMILGIAAGVAITIQIVSFLLDQYRDILLSLLLGMLLASLKFILVPEKKFKWGITPIIAAISGFLITWLLLAGETLSLISLETGASPFVLFAGGTLASATMLIPGVSGSSILIMLNIYDDVLFSLKKLIWANILFFSGGLAAGLFLFARLITALYQSYKMFISFFLAGLVLGSTRVLFPENLNAGVLVFILAGAFLVIFLGRSKY